MFFVLKEKEREPGSDGWSEPKFEISTTVLGCQAPFYHETVYITYLEKMTVSYIGFIVHILYWFTPVALSPMSFGSW